MGGFADRWGWVSCVDAVSETMRTSWDAVLAMTAMEFLNVLSYRRDKKAAEKESIDKWKQTH